MTNSEVKRYFKEYILPPRGFIYNDIQREISLARSGNAGGNFLSALGLLCYTEFLGKMFLQGRYSSNKQCFNAFFRSMGANYAQLINANNVNIYRKFRCGMTHAYFVGDCDIKMLDNNYQAGIVIKPDGKYFFVVEKYFEDFMNACQQLYNRMITEQNPHLPST